MLLTSGLDGLTCLIVYFFTNSWKTSVVQETNMQVPVNLTHKFVIRKSPTPHVLKIQNILARFRIFYLMFFDFWLFTKFQSFWEINHITRDYGLFELMWKTVSKKGRKTYGEIDGGGDDESPVAAEMSVGDIGPQNRSHPDGAHPVGHIVWCGNCPLVQLPR